MKFLSLAFMVLCNGSLVWLWLIGEDELRQWMADERAQARPRVTPIAEPKQFNPQPYTADAGWNHSTRLADQALRRESAQVASNAAPIAPEMARRKSHWRPFRWIPWPWLEALNKTSKTDGFAKGGQPLYQVQVGNYLGQNYGRITAITETAIQLREIVQDATGDWIERATSLELQEEAKK